MDTWTTQKGYPLVTAERLYLTGTVNITQKKLNENSAKSEELWIIPISYTTSKMNGTVKNIWVKTRSELKKNITQPGDDKSWILLNVEQTGIIQSCISVCRSEIFVFLQVSIE